MANTRIRLIYGSKDMPFSKGGPHIYFKGGPNISANF